MQIIWKGQSLFQIITKPDKNSQLSIVIDPFNEGIGLKVPKLEANILLITHRHQDHNNIKAVSGNPFLIEGPGEYEVKGIYIEGIPSWHNSKEGKERLQPSLHPPTKGGPLGENTIYTIEAEEMRLCHLGDLGQRELTEDQLNKVGDVDILMIPVGGVYTISAKEAIKIMAQIEPKIIIPMHYQIPKLTLKLEGLDKFLKPLGIKSIETLPKLSIKKRDLSPEEAKIIVLKP
jgi:L-ascorbate metabolism protein UlaG (beta-lactamase superfamily)